MAQIHDDDYGLVEVRRSARSKYIRLSVATGGNLLVSAPLYTPLRFVKYFIKKSKPGIADMLKQQSTSYTHDMLIGKSHRLEVSSAQLTEVTYKKPVIRLTLAENDHIESMAVQAKVRPMVAKALRAEAKAYLPRRLDHLAQKMDLTYRNLRFSHAKSRWGSCSSDKTISLNIGLMKLDFELIDYVIVHELAHTTEPNHAPPFWQLVEQHDPEYKSHRKALKQHSPHI